MRKRTSVSTLMTAGPTLTKPSLAGGGAGVWWPGRTSGTQDERLRGLPLSDAEQELAHHEQRESGLAPYIRVCGYAVRSTGTELAAAIIVFSAHGHIQLASDNDAFVKSARKMTRAMRERRAKPRKWQLVKDGDLWHHFCCALKYAFWATRVMVTPLKSI